MNPVIVDARWSGDFGIGRFGREVRSRLHGDDFRFYESERSPLSVMGMWELRQELRRQSPSAFFSPAFTGTLPVRNVPQFLTVFDLIHLDEPSERSLAKSAYYARVVLPAIVDSGWVATSSAYSARRIGEWLGPRVDDVVIDVVGCGISSDFVESTDELEIDSPATFLMVSNVGAHKNPGLALQALKQSSGSARLHWVVSDVVAASRLADEHGLRERVDFSSNISDAELARLYRSATALLFPSKIEGFGLPPVEAMACGTPVIYSSTCEAAAETCAGTPENIGIESTSDVDSWAEAINAMERSRSRVASAENIRSRYSWERVSDLTVRRLRSAMVRRR